MHIAAPVFACLRPYAALADALRLRPGKHVRAKQHIARISSLRRGIIKPEEAMKMLNKGHQKIDCRVCSCAHHTDDDVCDLDCICVQPMTGSNQKDAAGQTLCGSYKCCGK